jgi:CheY-like chemotaxis protein
LLDLSMPELDGAETLRELRACRPDVRVILSSGYDEAEARARLRVEGFAGFLRKPYSAADLAEQIGSAILVSGTSRSR